MGKSKVEQDKHTDRRPGARPASTGYPIHSVPWQDLGDALEVMAPIGGALRIGLTRDGGALASGVYGLGEPYTAYIRPSDDLSLLLDELTNAFDVLARPTTAPEDQAKLPSL